MAKPPVRSIPIGTSPPKGGLAEGVSELDLQIIGNSLESFFIQITSNASGPRHLVLQPSLLQKTPLFYQLHQEGGIQLIPHNILNDNIGYKEISPKEVVRFDLTKGSLSSLVKDPKKSHVLKVKYSYTQKLPNMNTQISSQEAVKIFPPASVSIGAKGLVMRSTVPAPRK